MIFPPPPPPPSQELIHKRVRIAQEFPSELASWCDPGHCSSQVGQWGWVVMLCCGMLFYIMLY